MPEILGPMTIVQRALPSGVDGTKLAEWQLREGISLGQFIALAGTAVGGVNQEFVQKWGRMFTITEMDHLEYPDGAAETELAEVTDIDDPDMVSGTTIGHMIDLRVYGGAIGGSRRYFRDARMAQIQSTMRRIVNKTRWRFEKKLLNRFMTNTENAIGSAGYDVPFVRGTAGNIDFAPISYGGQVFTTSHNHFLGFDSGSSKTFADVFNDLAKTLAEHGHEPPFTAMCSLTDVVTIAALTKFVQLVSPTISVIQRGGETSGNQLFSVGQPDPIEGLFGRFQSTFGQIDLYSYARIPTGYVGMYKSYGQLDPRNPLAVRVHPDEGFGLQIVATPSDNPKWPLQKLNFEFEFGVGVGEDRTNGAVGYLVSGGTYANPTIS
jgi:hypothetical protein